ncbi:hypothetical protein DYB34_010240, partial [Aphanomyces astaci]
MARNSKDRAQKPKAAATAPAAASSETEEEVPVTEPPLVPVVGGTTDVLPAVEESKSDEVRKTMEELAAANKAMGSARAASMTWDESRRRYGGQTMGPNWEQLPRPPIEGAYVDEDYPPPEKSDAEKRAEEKAEARAKLLSWVKKRETYEDKLRANAQRMGGEWRRSAVGWIPSTDRSLLKATCTYVWRVPVEQLSEDDYRDRIMEIVGQPATKWTPTKSDMQNYCRTLSVDPHGDVTSRLVSFMERVDDVIDENGLRQQLKDSTMLRTFVKVVAARVTPSYLRDRVEEQMKTVPANDLVAFADILREQLDRTHDADMVNQQRNSYGSKRGREEDDQGRRITKHAKKANQAVRDQRELRGNYPPNMQAKRMKKPQPPSKEDDGRWVRLNSVLEVPYCPDTGADQNIVPQAMVDELQALQPQLQVVKLAAPFVGTACNQMPFEASSYVDLTLTMQTAAGPVKVPGKRRCYVVNDGDEFLVSDDTLKTIGIDIDRLLEQVARLQVDDDGDDLEEV